MDLLNSEPVVSLSGDEFLPIEGKTFTQQVQEFFSAQGGKASSPFGIVLLDKRGIKNDLGHGIGRLKAASFAAVKDVLEKGVVINPMGQYHTNNKKNPTGMIAAPITIGGEKYVCVVEVIANRQVTRLYVHEVTLTKNLQGDVADSNAVPEDNSLVTQPQGEIAKVLRNYVNTKNNGENNTKTEDIHMNKHLIRLTESDLHRIVKESVNIILREGDKGYFKRVSPYGYEDPTIPSNNKYSNADANRPATETDRQRLRFLQKSFNPNDKDWDELLSNSDYAYSEEDANNFANGELSKDPDNAFDAASKKHILRGLRNDNAPQDFGGKFTHSRGRSLLVRLAKRGIPINVAKQLSTATLNQIMKELRKQ